MNTNDKLHTVTVTIESDLTKKLNSDDVIDAFSNEYAQRQQF